MTETKERMYKRLVFECGLMIPETYFEFAILPKFVDYDGTYDEFCVEYTRKLNKCNINVIEEFMNEWEDLFIENQELQRKNQELTISREKCGRKLKHKSTDRMLRYLDYMEEKIGIKYEGNRNAYYKVAKFIKENKHKMPIP